MVWEKELSIFNILESAAYLTEFQSGAFYATLSIILKSFNNLLNKCETIIRISAEIRNI